MKWTLLLLFGTLVFLAASVPAALAVGNANGPPIKVTVCHVPPNSNAASQTLEIPIAALGGHLGHGDFIKGEGGCAEPSVDECPNIKGDQATVPAGLIKDEAGDCVETPPPPPPPVDVCPNIEGAQATTPAGLIKDEAGNCIAPPATPGAPPTDLCPNIEGAQSAIPDGLVLSAAGNCVATEVVVAAEAQGPDACPNIEGDQPSVPRDLVTNAAGNCVAYSSVAAAEVVEVTAAATAVPTTVAAVPTGELPFTGAETWIAALLGSVVMLLGALLHVAGRRKGSVAVAK